MRSGRAPSRSARCCWSAKRRTATFPRTRQATARRSARSSSGSPRKAVSMASRWASSPSVRPILAEGVLSQCGTIISMRLNNDRDQACVRAAMPEGARGFLDAIPALRNRECIVCGEGVAIPIRVRFDDLEPEKRPASSDPSFAAPVARDRRRRRHHPAHDQALARPRTLRLQGTQFRRLSGGGASARSLNLGVRSASRRT